MATALPTLLCVIYTFGNECYKISVVAVGGFNAPEQIEEAIASGKCDFAALGRQQFADPEFVNKTITRHADEIAPTTLGFMRRSLSGK